MTLAFENLLLPFLRSAQNVTDTTGTIIERVLGKTYAKDSVVRNRASWAFSYLSNAKFVWIAPASKKVRLTSEGKRFLTVVRSRDSISRIDLILHSDQFARHMLEIELNRRIGGFDMRVIAAIETRLGITVTKN